MWLPLKKKSEKIQAEIVPACIQAKVWADKLVSDAEKSIEKLSNDLYNSGSHWISHRTASSEEAALIGESFRANGYMVGYHFECNMWKIAISCLILK